MVQILMILPLCYKVNALISKTFEGQIAPDQQQIRDAVRGTQPGTARQLIGKLFHPLPGLKIGHKKTSTHGRADVLILSRDLDSEATPA